MKRLLLLLSIFFAIKSMDSDRQLLTSNDDQSSNDELAISISGNIFADAINNGHVSAYKLQAKFDDIRFGELSDNNKLLLSTFDKIIAYDLEQSRLLCLKDFEGTITKISLNPVGNMFAVASSNPKDSSHINAETYNLNESCSLISSMPHRCVTGLKFNKVGKKLYLAGRTHLKFCSLQFKSLGFMPSEDNISNFSLDSNDRIVAVGYANGQIKIWDIQENTGYHLADKDCPVKSLALTNDSNFLIAGFGHKDKDKACYNLKVWNLRTREIAQSLKGHTAEVTEAQLSPDNKFVVSVAFDGIAKIWRTSDWKSMATITRKHNSEIGASKQFQLISNVAIANDSKTLFIGFDKCGETPSAIGIFNLENLEQISLIATYTDFESDIKKIILSKNNNYLISIGNQPKIYSFLSKLPEQDLIAEELLDINIDPEQYNIAKK